MTRPSFQEMFQELGDHADLTGAMLNLKSRYALVHSQQDLSMQLKVGRT